MIRHGLSDRTVTAIQGVLAAFPEVEKAVLYGSRAKGNHKPGSDVDVALFGRDLNETFLSRIASDLDDLLLPYEIDLSLFSKLKDPALVEHIQRVGIPLFERTVAAAER